MIKTIHKWLTTKWRLINDSQDTMNAVAVTFSTPHGQAVMQYLLDNIYCTVYEGTDPYACMAHNARRAVIHELLRDIDFVANPGKYRVRELLEAQGGGLEFNES